MSHKSSRKNKKSKDSDDIKTEEKEVKESKDVKEIKESKFPLTNFLETGDDKVYSPYIDTEQHGVVPLSANQLNGEIYNNIKANLANLILRKCNKYGYIRKIYELLSYENGVSNNANNSGSVKYDITYSCNLCLPMKNTKIVCKVLNISTSLITAVNGPINVYIPVPKNINTNNFIIDHNSLLKFKSPDDSVSTLINKNDVVVCLLLTEPYFSLNGEEITEIGILDNVANEEQKKFFFNDDIDGDAEIVESGSEVIREEKKTEKEEVPEIKSSKEELKKKKRKSRDSKKS